MNAEVTPNLRLQRTRNSGAALAVAVLNAGVRRHGNSGSKACVFMRCYTPL